MNPEETEDLLTWLRPMGPEWRAMDNSEPLQAGDIGLVLDEESRGFYLAYAGGWIGRFPGSPKGPDKAWTRRPKAAKEVTIPPPQPPEKP